MANYRFDNEGNVLPPEPRTITEINDYIKQIIESEVQLQDILVIGELSNFKKHTSGHCYFSLKDEYCEIRAVMFSSSAKKLAFKPENGMKVLINARVGVYTQGGSYQLYVTNMQPDGIGSLYLAFEQLKEKLNNEGLFDEVHKKQIPKFPKRIGVITSQTGAAIRDIINVSTRRNPGVNLLLYPTLVQGPEASYELTRAVEYFNIENNVDVIIIGRGGGSIEDLWAFNDEKLARAIYNSKIPVISGVGHEIDYTICDFVADLRAATPSAAAELATPNVAEYILKLSDYEDRINNAFFGMLNYYKEKIEILSKSKVLLKPLTMLDVPTMQVVALTEKLEKSFNSVLHKEKEHFAKINAKLVALNPMSILSRGYGAVFDKDNLIVRSVEDLKIGEDIKVSVADGNVYATVNSKEKNNG